MSQSFYIFADSRSKEYGSNSSFALLFENNPDVGEGSVKIGLDEVMIVNGVFPIRSGNNTFTFAEGGGALTATVTPGYYNSLSFCTAVKTAMQAVGALVYTPTISSTTNFLTISATGNFTLSFASGNFWKVAGFAKTYAGAAAASHTGSMPVRLDGDEYLYLELLNTSNDNMVGNYPGSTVLDTIPLDKGFGNLIYYKSNPQNNFTLVRADDVQEVRLRLRDPDGYDWPIPENCPVFIKLRCFQDMFVAE